MSRAGLKALFRNSSEYVDCDEYEKGTFIVVFRQI